MPDLYRFLTETKKMLGGSENVAQTEIYKTLGLCNYCTRQVGLSFIDKPKNLLHIITRNSWLLLSTIVLFLMVAGEIGYVATQLVTSSSVEDFVSGVHIVGYDAMSFGKLLTIWYKRDVFKHLLKELEDIWPVSVLDKEAVEIKRERLSALRIGQFWYAFWNILGVWLYNLTPIIVYVYRKIQGKTAYLGYIWLLCYPFDKTKPGYHEFAFVFEAYGGVVSVWCMLGSDMLFMTMASHISMLLRILQVKIKQLGTVQNGISGKRVGEVQDCYKDIVSVIKIHQRLITYGNDLEDAFSVVNLINVLLSSVNICCVVFNILLDPWMAMSNKFFLGAALTQVGILCWYADDIYTAITKTSLFYCLQVSFYNNENLQFGSVMFMWAWSHPYFKINCCGARKGLNEIFTHVPLNLSIRILTSSYSYFTLLYTMYRSD